MTEEILVVGAGTGGSVLVNRLAERLENEIADGDVRVTIVNDGEYHYYKPTYLYIPFGKKTIEDAKRPLDQLLDRRINRVTDRVTAIDTDGHSVSLASGNELEYDQLVLAMGTAIVPEEIPGLAEAGHHFYGPDGAQKLRAALADFEEGHLVLSVIGVPHMCPAAPVEFVLMVDDWLRERGRREETEITYTYPIQRAHGIQSVADFATDLFAERDISLETFVNPEEIHPEAQTIETMEGKELDFDLLVGIPPHSGSDLVSEASLGDDGWVDVDNETLEATRAKDIYAIGDVADVATSKAGSVAHYEAGVVADRIASRSRGERPTERYHGKTVCFIETGLDEATFIEFEYGDEPTVRAPSRAIHWAKLGYNQSYWLTARGLL